MEWSGGRDFVDEKKEEDAGEGCIYSVKEAGSKCDDEVEVLFVVYLEIYNHSAL